MPGTYISPAETGLYYLQSRYYNPEIGRFLNADDVSLLAVSPGCAIYDNNLFAYCDNNPIIRLDAVGDFWETALDVASLCLSIAEVCGNPYDAWAWIGLAGDIVDLCPFVTGVGEVTRLVKNANVLIDGVKVKKATDFTMSGIVEIKKLEHIRGFTKSTINAGQSIHKSYKSTDIFSPYYKEYNRIKGIRPDYLDWGTKVIYELKPNNTNSIRRGVNQLKQYQSLVGTEFSLVLELY